jgi:hypothetical protein
VYKQPNQLDQQSLKFVESSLDVVVPIILLIYNVNKPILDVQQTVYLDVLNLLNVNNILKKHAISMMQEM